MSEQEMNLASILAIVTNPDMVAKNIQKLQADMANAHVALKAVEDKHAEVNAQHAAAKEIAEKAEIRHNDLNVRELELKKGSSIGLIKTRSKRKRKKLSMKLNCNMLRVCVKLTNWKPKTRK